MTSTALMWCGAATTSSLQPVFGISGTAASVRAAFSLTADFAAPSYSTPVVPDANGYARPGNVTGLAAGTRYYYCAEIDGALDLANVARARTLKTNPTVVRVTFGSCWANTGQGGATTHVDHPVGAACAAQDADLHLFTGDLGYANIATNSTDAYRANWEGMHAIPNFAALARATAWSYVWDDHDFGPDNSDSTAAGTPAAQAVYRQMVPHYPLPDDPNGIYHSFVVGNVRFVVTDLRSYRSPDTNTDDAAKTMLGATQKAWLKAQWLAAKTASQLIVWVSSSVWCIDGNYSTTGLNTDGDHWGAFTTERAELDNYRATNAITDMVILVGDMHGIAYRTRVDYSTAQTVPTPVFCSAAYSRTAADRPAAWDVSSSPASPDGHYSVLVVSRGTSTGWAITCEFHTVDPVTTADVVTFTADLSYGLPSLTRAVARDVNGQRLRLLDSSGRTVTPTALA